MATIADDISVFPAGARFFRAVLQVQSFGASHDVEDAGMPPAAIVDMAIAETCAAINRDALRAQQACERSR